MQSFQALRTCELQGQIRLDGMSRYKNPDVTRVIVKCYFLISFQNL